MLIAIGAAHYDCVDRTAWVFFIVGALAGAVYVAVKLYPQLQAGSSAARTAPGSPVAVIAALGMFLNFLPAEARAAAAGTAFGMLVVSAIALLMTSRAQRAKARAELSS